ncbi:MAG: 3-hydroxyisobutyrate dehydrogenase [Aestuariibacter sp.]
MASVAFIGLGNMGGPMAINLIKAGHEVSVFDLVPSQVAKLVEAGAKQADSAKIAAQDAEFVISMLPASKHVKQLYLGEDGLVNSLHKDCIVIDSSTIDAELARDVGAALHEAGIRFVDAPVSGGVGGAVAGTLTFIVGGVKTVFTQVEPVLSAMGKNIFHAGDIGAGQIAKICNNMLLAVLMTGTSEALQMAINNGLDPKVMSDIMLQSSGRNWTLELYNPCPDVMPNVPSSNNYQGGFLVDLMKKDLGLAMDAANQSQSMTPMGALAASLYNIHSAHGNGQKDFSSIFEMLATQNQGK